MIIYIIIFFAVSGLCCAFFAIMGVSKQEALLRQSPSEQVLGSVKEERLQALRAWIAHEKETKHRGNEVRVGQGFHLLLRLSTIADSISRTDAREIPSLGDLHTLTLQDETSRFCSMALRTITSFMLILGIAGTLWGVHVVLSAPNDQGVFSITNLPSALEPSMLAVSCTVLLMWIRGYYMAALDAFLERLDLYTMTEIVPKLQPMSNVGISASSFMGQLSQLGHLLQAVKSSAEQLQQTQKSVETLKTASDGLAEEYRQIAVKNQGFEEDVAAMKNNLKEAAAAMDNAKDASFEGSLKQVREHCKLILKNSENFQSVLQSVSQSSKALSEGNKAMSQLKAQAEKTAVLAGLVLEFKKSMHVLLKNSAHITKSWEKMEALKTAMEEAKAGTVDSSQHAREALQTTQQTMDYLSHAPSAFDSDIQKDQDRVVAVRREFEEELQRCIDVGGKLNKEFQKRAEKVNLN